MERRQLIGEQVCVLVSSATSILNQLSRLEISNLGLAKKFKLIFFLRGSNSALIGLGAHTTPVFLFKQVCFLL